MAGARAAASLSLTIGVAFATVLIVGGILAGPTILDCSHQPSSFGACLRDRLDHARLVPTRDEPSQMPVLSSEAAPPSVPEPPSRLADLGHPDGWLDARANEYEPPASSALEPPALPPLPALAASDGPPEPSSSAVAAIDPVTPPSLPQLPLPVTPAPPAQPPEPSSSELAISEPAPPSSPSPQPVTTIKPKAEVPKKPALKPARAARVVPKAPSRPAVRTFKNDPRFPNVTVLPRPGTGDNSSFVTLKTH